MKIKDISIFPVGQFVYVKIISDEGIYGLGEASLSGRNLAVVEAVKHIKPFLIGEDATRIEYLWQEIFRGTFWRGGPALQSALAGIDIALWDLNGKALGVPVYRLLGGAARDRVLVYRHSGGKTPGQLVETSQGLLENGWRVLRISPIDFLEYGFNPKLAIRNGMAHFSALRKAIGDEVEIIFEAHTRLTPIRAIELCNAIEEFHPFFVEDPIRSENPGSFATLRAHTHVPLTTGEQLTNKWAYPELIEQELIDYLQVDICHTGAITEGKKLATMAEVHYQELAMHYTASPVSTAAMLHLNMSMPNCAVQEHNPPRGYIEDVIQYDWRVEDGYLIPSDFPGLGIDIDEQAAAAYGHKPEEPPHWRREDVSVQDW
jgi:galactonate dehydratase